MGKKRKKEAMRQTTMRRLFTLAPPSSKCANAAYEKGETQNFYNDFFEICGASDEAIPISQR